MQDLDISNITKKANDKVETIFLTSVTKVDLILQTSSKSIHKTLTFKMQKWINRHDIKNEIQINKCFLNAHTH